MFPRKFRLLYKKTGNDFIQQVAKDNNVNNSILCRPYISKSDTMVLLTRELTEKRISSLPTVPKEWDVFGGHYYYYQLNLRMCQLRNLNFEFKWGDESDPTPKVASVLEQPSRILSLDISLNDISSLEHQSLAPLKQLRILDASLNRIEGFVGVEVLRQLYRLNLSHNKIRHIMGLQNCRFLVELNLGMNEIHDISYMPTLSALRVLHLNNNKLESLEGVQSLAQLQELYVQRNKITDLVPLTTSFRLCVLNAADNLISSFHNTVQILKGLERLETLCLYGNPIDRENNYHSKLTSELNISSLDNINVRPNHKALPSYDGTISGVKEVARAAFYDHLKAVKGRMEENVRFLQKRIINLQEEYKQYEERMQQDLNNCMRYMDRLPVEQAHQYNHDFLRQKLPTQVAMPWLDDRASPAREPLSLPPIHSHRDRQGAQGPSSRERDRPKQERDGKEWGLLDEWEQQSPRGRKARKKADYSNIKETDELLRFAYNELVREKGALNAPVV